MAFCAMTLGVAGQANITRAVTAQEQRTAKSLVWLFGGKR